MPKTQSPRDQWLQENHPALFYTIHALDGDRKALRWLEGNTSTLYQLCKAVGGDPVAAASLQNPDPVERALLVEVMDQDDLLDCVRQHHADVHLLLQAGRGDETARRRLQLDNSSLVSLVEVLRRWYCEKTTADGNDEPLRDGAADVGLLVGEMHLAKREYEKAVDAFTRALESQPTADAYEGRARAYRGLAEEDDRLATLLNRVVV